MVEVLELEVGDSTLGKAESDAGLVALVKEVPHINAVCLGYEDYSRSGGTEGATGVVRAKSVG
jgi:hypothetical protein